MPPAKLTLREQARLCTSALKQAKVSANIAGKEMPWSEVESVIYGALTSPGDVDSPFGVRTVVPPKPEWVTAYSASIGFPVDGEAWCDSYEQKGWTVGKHPMRNWQAAVRNWKANKWGDRGIALAGSTATKAKDYSRL